MARALARTCLIFLLMFGGIGLAHADSPDAQNIHVEAGKLRLQIAKFEGNLLTHLQQALDETPNRIITCEGELKSFYNCVHHKHAELLSIPLTILETTRKGQDSPLEDLRAAEERYAIYIDRMNKANDLISQAGGTLFIPDKSLTPEIDRLRKRIIEYVEQRQEHSMHDQRMMMIGGIVLVLLVIFGAIFLLMHKIKA